METQGRRDHRRELSSPETGDRVLAFLMDISSQRGLATASTTDIAAACGVGQSTAMRATRRLLDAGALAVHRKGTGDGYPTVWKVQSPSISHLADVTAGDPS